MSYEVNVLVNGSRCKQYSHQGKLFIEAKKGSEYSIEIKNGTWQRILAVCSVDGLDILNGKPAEANGNGYVINGYGSLKADGFRVSNEKVAKFLFDYKGGSYAASKEDGSERNVGVIGVRIFQEKPAPPPPPPTIIREEHHHHHDYPWWKRPYWYDNTTIWCGGLTGSPGPTYGSSTARSDDSDGCLDFCEQERSSEGLYSCDSVPTKGAPSSTMGKGIRSRSMKSSAGGQSCGASTVGQKLSFAGNSAQGSTAAQANLLRAMNCSANAMPEPLGFDMGTKWGEAKESRVIEVEFEKGVLALTTNIYYASRQSLVEMGVPLGNEKQVSFPEPFDDKYAKPPKNWQG